VRGTALHYALMSALLALAAVGPARSQEAEAPLAAAAEAFAKPDAAALAQTLADARAMIAGGSLTQAEGADLLFAIATRQVEAGRKDEAVGLALEALAKAEAAPDVTLEARVQALRRAAEILRGAGRAQEAVALLRRAQQAQLPLGADNPARRFVLADLAASLELAGSAGEATPLTAEVERLAGLEAGRDGDVVTMGGGKDDAKAAYELVTLHYVTNRRRTAQTDPYLSYAGDAGAVTYGRARVSVPRVRDLGSVPRPNVWKLEFSNDPSRHVVLTSTTLVRDRGAFVGSLANQIGRSERKEAFVFIHGFNTSFSGAAARAAQLAIDLEIDGAPILFSWPSKGELLAYGVDETQATSEASVAALAALLEDVATKSGARRIYVVGHSMGNRVLLRALARVKAVAPPAGRGVLLDEVVLAAPDVPQAEFKQRVTALKGVSRRMTLYASKRDRALQVSAMVNKALRAGDATPAVLIPGVLETVDTTAATQGLLGHTDFAGTARDDLRAVLWADLPPLKRCILASSTAGWMFGKASCDETSFRAAVWFWRRTGTRAKALLAFDLAIADFTRRAAAGGEAGASALRNADAYRRGRDLLVKLGMP